MLKRVRVGERKTVYIFKNLGGGLSSRSMTISAIMSGKENQLRQLLGQTQLEQ